MSSFASGVPFRKAAMAVALSTQQCPKSRKPQPAAPVNSKLDLASQALQQQATQPNAQAMQP